MSETDLPRVRVTCALIVDAGRILLAQRGQGMDQPGFWEFPGGKQEPGESEPDCVVREIREELGLELEALTPLGEFPWRLGQRWIVLLPWLCRVRGGSLHLREHAAVKWVPLAELSVDFPGMAPPDVPVLAHFLTMQD